MPVADVLCALDESGRLHRRVPHRNDLLVLTVKDQGRHSEPLLILGAIGLEEGFDAFVGVVEIGPPFCGFTLRRGTGPGTRSAPPPSPREPARRPSGRRRG